jgi:hypothetical protein
VGGGFIDPSFDADATFCRNSQRRYESAGLSGYFLRRSGAHLVLSRVDALNDASSLTDTIFFERDPETLRPRPNGGFQVDADRNHSSTAYGPCTGTTPFLGQARTTFVQTVLLNDQALRGSSSAPPSRPRSGRRKARSPSERVHGLRAPNTINGGHR